ncbi:MAG: hypothetical protein M1820_008570 [Bogoriella megaspora]|nr:MAG: hypothetical protein M1820_008570 [Bogoriella megaspora]
MSWLFQSKYPERRPEDVADRDFDYVVVGGGTAGCVLASRLSEDPDVSVLLLERGVANDTFISRVPLVSCDILNPDTGAIGSYCEPLKHLDDRRSLIFRGEVLGGTSRINAMIYTRGSVADYDTWSAMGYPDWSYEKMLPYFLKAENTINQPKPEYRGNSGPLINQTIVPSKWQFDAYRASQKGAEALGFGHIPDANSPEALCDGFATLDCTINENMQRMSTFDAFLSRDIALERHKHLTICTKSVVSRIEFSSEGKTSRAEKVHFHNTDDKNKKDFSVSVRREVIVCSGAIGSPQVLMLSGIGPRKHLEEHEIEVVRNLPGVGSELRDHVSIPVSWEVPVKQSLAYITVSPLRGAWELLKYFFNRTGILSMPLQMSSLYVRSFVLDDKTSEFYSGIPSKPPMSRHGVPSLRTYEHLSDIEIMPLPTNVSDDFDEDKLKLSKTGVFSLLTTLLRPKSRGTVRLASSDPFDRPKIDLGFMADAEDIALAKKAIRLSLRLGEEMKAQDFPLLCGITAPDPAADDVELEKLIRRKARTTYHYSSTCRMAPEDDADAPGVVDDVLRVHGVPNLRVCDASIFPKMLSAHLQAPVVAVAEKCADLIKVDYRS